VVVLFILLKETIAKGNFATRCRLHLV